MSENEAEKKKRLDPENQIMLGNTHTLQTQYGENTSIDPVSHRKIPSNSSIFLARKAQ